MARGWANFEDSAWELTLRAREKRGPWTRWSGASSGGRLAEPGAQASQSTLGSMLGIHRQLSPSGHLFHLSKAPQKKELYFCAECGTGLGESDFWPMLTFWINLFTQRV